MTKTRKDFISTRLWLQNVMTNDVILCGVSALEYLEMFSGFFDEAIIDVYSIQKGSLLSPALPMLQLSIPADS